MRCAADLLGGQVLRQHPLELVGPAQVQLGEVHQVDDGRLGQRDRARVQLLRDDHVGKGQLVEAHLEVAVAEARVRPAQETDVVAPVELGLGAREVEQSRLHETLPDLGHRAHRQAVRRPTGVAGLAGEGHAAITGGERGGVVALDVPGDGDRVPERGLVGRRRPGDLGERVVGQAQGGLDLAVLRQPHDVRSGVGDAHAPDLGAPGGRDGPEPSDFGRSAGDELPTRPTQ